MMTNNPLWTKERISQVATECSQYRVAGTIRCMSQATAVSLMMEMHDDYQAALDAANAGIAELEGERQAWRAEALRLRDAIMQMDSGNLRQDDSTAPAAQTPNAERLLPCPFCGGEVEIQHQGKSWYVWCEKCDDAYGEYLSKINARQRWNRRAPAAQAEWQPVEDGRHVDGGNVWQVHRGMVGVAPEGHSRIYAGKLPDGWQLMRRRTHAATGQTVQGGAGGPTMNIGGQGNGTVRIGTGAEWEPDVRDFVTLMKLAWKGWEHDDKQYDQVADMLHRIDNWIARRT